MVTRDSAVRKLCGASDRASMDTSQLMFEVIGLNETRMNLFSGISEMLLIVNHCQSKLSIKKIAQTLDRPLTGALGPI
jgi:hypothetical protein